MTANKYVFFRNDQKVENFEFDPQNPDCLDEAGFKYFGRVLNTIEPRIRDQGFTFYVTAWTVHELPSYGPNVIACILQDEWSRDPTYRDKVGMVFRTCGKYPVTLESYKYGGISDIFSNFLGQSNSVIRGGTGRFKTLGSVIKRRRIAPVYNIPLGYYPRDDVDYIPIEDRKHDLYFAGSIKHSERARIIIRRPKEQARGRMAESLRDTGRNHPHIKIKSAVTSGFSDSISTDNASYLDNMMNTKICPIPRGANLETFRFYEAIRYGCIPVGEAFPNDYFYNDAPILRLKDWSYLSDVASDLLKDDQRLQELHKKSLDWWQKICSEEATANFMYEKIRADLH